MDRETVLKLCRIISWLKLPVVGNLHFSPLESELCRAKSLQIHIVKVLKVWNQRIWNQQSLKAFSLHFTLSGCAHTESESIAWMFACGCSELTASSGKWLWWDLLVLTAGWAWTRGFSVSASYWRRQSEALRPLMPHHFLFHDRFPELGWSLLQKLCR